MDLNNVEYTWIKNKPINWKIHRVKNHFVLTKNKTDSPEGYPILSLTMKGIIERDISSNEGQLPETYNGYNLLEKNDIVFNPMDLISGWVDCSPLKGLISPSYKVIRPTSIEVDIKFYTYYFQTHYKEKIFFPFGEGIHYEYRWGLGTETLKNFPIVVPPLHEQQQIVSFLDNKTSLIDSLIEKTQRKIELLKEKRTSLINEVVTKGLNPNVELKDSGVEWIGKIPSSWTIPKMSYLLVGITDGTHGTHERVNEGKIFLSSKNITNKGIFIGKNESKITTEEHEKIVKKGYPVKGDILITVVGSIGRSCVYEYDYPISFQRSVCFLRFKEKINEYFMNFLIHSDVIQFQLLKNTKKSTQGGVYMNDLKRFDIILPSLPEQQQIVEYLDEQTQRIDKTISLEEKRIELLKEYRKSLISELVTGKLKVTKDE